METRNNHSEIIMEASTEQTAEPTVTETSAAEPATETLVDPPTAKTPLPDLPDGMEFRWFLPWLHNPRLCILIPSLRSRSAQLAGLLRNLELQLHPASVQICILLNDGQEPIGAIRNRLLQAAVDAKAEYVVFIDDDDTVPPDYVQKVLGGLHANPDAVGFKVNRFHEGELRGVAVHSDQFDDNADRKRDEKWTDFDRILNHLNPVRTLIAREIGYAPIPAGEDRDYSVRLKKSGLLKHVQFVDEVLYDYRLTSKSAS